MSQAKRVFRIAEALMAQRGIVRAKDLLAAGVRSQWLHLLEPSVLVCQAPGVLVRPYVGYPLAVRAGVKWPSAVIGGFSALNLYGLCGEPPELAISIDHRAKAPKPVIPLDIRRVRGLAADPDRRVLLSWRVPTHAFSIERSLVDLIERLEVVPVAALTNVLRRALREGRTSEAALMEVAERRRSDQCVRAALKVLAPLAERHLDVPAAPFVPPPIDEEQWSLNARGHGKWTLYSWAS